MKGLCPDCETFHMPAEGCPEHRCARCGEPNPEHEERDGCRDPECPENGVE